MQVEIKIDSAYTEPKLVNIMGNEIKAVIFQAVLCGILGAGFGAGSVIWEAEEWNLVKQTGVYFILVSVSMMPVAYFNYWMEHSVGGFLSYFVILNDIPLDLTNRIVDTGNVGN